MSNTNGTITIIPPPEGYVVDFENPQTQFVVQGYTVAAVEMTLAFIFLVQRLYTKIVIMKSFQLEDSKLFSLYSVLYFLTRFQSHSHCCLVPLHGHSDMSTPWNVIWSHWTTCVGDKHRKVWILFAGKFAAKTCRLIADD
jgi:hypothetical protein